MSSLATGEPGSAIDPALPCSAAPGSPEKIRVLAVRASARKPLFHPGDGTMHEHESPPPLPLTGHTCRLPSGVSRHRSGGEIRYRARIRLPSSRKKVSLGLFDTVEEAVAAIEQEKARRRESWRAS